MLPLGEQLRIFVATVFIGMVAGFIYDLYKKVTRLLRLKNFFFADLCFWVILTIVVFGLLIINNRGEMRLYVLLGLILGAFIYFSVFAEKIKKFIF